MLPVKDRVLALEKKGWFGVLMAGEEGPNVMESNVFVGMVGPLLFDRDSSRLRGRSAGIRSVGGRGAGPGFMNWLLENMLHGFGQRKDSIENKGHTSVVVTTDSTLLHA